MAYNGSSAQTVGIRLMLLRDYLNTNASRVKAVPYLIDGFADNWLRDLHPFFPLNSLLPCPDCVLFRRELVAVFILRFADILFLSVPCDGIAKRPISVF